MEASILETTVPSTIDHNWLSTKKVEQYLNVTRHTLYKQKNIDRFKSDVHYRILNPEAARPTYEWNVPAIESCMEEALDDVLTAV
jgi:hypothetical protein